MKLYNINFLLSAVNIFVKNGRDSSPPPDLKYGAHLPLLIPNTYDRRWNDFFFNVYSGIFLFLVIASFSAATVATTDPSTLALTLTISSASASSKSYTSNASNSDYVIPIYNEIGAVADANDSNDKDNNNDSIIHHNPPISNSFFFFFSSPLFL